MRRHLASLITPQVQLAVFITIGFAATTAAADTGATGAGEWAFKPSYFSHDRVDGERVAQFAPGEKAYAQINNFRRSGYRQQRIRINGVGGSADNIHLVETWGAGEFIRPYGEWQRPFRDGATPYGPWGNPQGPWTQPFDSWSNPYGLGQLPHPPWPHWPNQPGPYPVYGNMPGGGPMPGGGHGGGGHGGRPGGGHGGGHGGGGHGGGPVPAQYQQP